RLLPGGVVPEDRGPSGVGMVPWRPRLLSEGWSPGDRSPLRPKGASGGLRGTSPDFSWAPLGTKAPPGRAGPPGTEVRSARESTGGPRGTEGSSRSQAMWSPGTAAPWEWVWSPGDRWGPWLLWEGWSPEDQGSSRGSWSPGDHPCCRPAWSPGDR